MLFRSGVAAHVTGSRPAYWLVDDDILPRFAGSGTPEGVIAAPIGSTYTADNGGASITFYVKTSGTGNTGWTAK